MTQNQTCYEVLGVSRTASPSEIRAAYMRLMKAHHPDAGPGRLAASRRPDLARLINRSYAVLKDPAKRAQYDAQLAFSDMPSRGQLQQTRMARVLRPSWRAAALFVALLAAAFLIVLTQQEAEKATPESLASGVGWLWPGSPTTVAVLAEPLPDESTVRHFAHLAKAIPLDSAELYSRQCFVRAAAQPSPSAAEPCILFDTAFLYWRKTPGPNAHFPPYFEDQLVSIRHSEALATTGPAADARLRALREIAFRALIDEVNAATLGLREREEPSPHLINETNSATVGDSDDTSAPSVP